MGSYYSNELQSLYLLNRVKDWNDFKNAIKHFRSISQNIIYADTKGNIGMYYAGGIPVRKKGNGNGLLPGWTDEYDWKGFVSFEKKPHVYNPGDNMVLSANNKSVDNSYPYYISNWFFPSIRYDRIYEMLLSKDNISIEDFQKMQNDDKSKQVEILYEKIITTLSNINSLNKLEQKAFDLFKNWNYSMSKDSAAATIFDTFYVELLENIFKDELGEELFKDFNGDSIMPLYSLVNLWKKGESEWFDNINTKDKKEVLSDIIEISFKKAIAWNKKKFGNKPEEWKWGKLHGLDLRHPLGFSPLLDFLFNLNRGPYPVNGSTHTVGYFAYNYNKPFNSNFGASQRHIYDLSNWDNSLSVIPTGNSGNPGSSHYCDQTKLYINGEYHNDYFSRELIEKNTVYTSHFTSE